MKRLKYFFTFSVATILAVSLCACGSSSKLLSTINENASYSDSYEYTNGFYSAAESADYASETYSDEDTSELLTDSSRKLIKTYNLDVETEDYDNLTAMLNNRIVSLGGYVESLDSYNGSSYSGSRNNRYSNMTVRIPSDKLDEFISFIGEKANVTDKSLNVEDVTLSYVDTEAKKESLEVEQQRLLELLEQAETVEDMLTIEDRLADVRYKLESQESQLRTYDNLVDYSTVYIYLSEVKKYTEPEPESYWERVGNAFTEGLSSVWDGLKEFLVWLAGAIPSLAVIAIIVFVIVIIFRAGKKSRKKKNAAKEEKRAEMLMEEAKAKAKEKAEKNE